MIRMELIDRWFSSILIGKCVVVVVEEAQPVAVGDSVDLVEVCSITPELKPSGRRVVATVVEIEPCASGKSLHLVDLV